MPAPPVRTSIWTPDPRLVQLAHLVRVHGRGSPRLRGALFALGGMAVVVAVEAQLNWRRVTFPPLHIGAVTGAVVVFAMALLVIVQRARLRRFVRQHRQGAWFGRCLECGGELGGDPPADAPHCPACGAPATRAADLLALGWGRHAVAVWRAPAPRYSKLVRCWQEQRTAGQRWLGVSFALGVGVTVGLTVLVESTAFRALSVPGYLFPFGPAVVMVAYILVVQVPLLRRQIRRFTHAHVAGAHFRLCLDCGYDLYGTFAAGKTICPECGAPATRLADLYAEVRWLR